jgi:hypothetical protein
VKRIIISILSILILNGCQTADKNESKYMKLVDQFAEVTLTADLSYLSDNQLKMLPLLFEAADIMQELFWQQAYGDKSELFDTLKDMYLKKYLEINFGPWERLNGNKPFISSVGAKPDGSNFYPKDMTKEEFDALDNPEKNSQYTLLRRNAEGNLNVIPYHEAYTDEVNRAAELLQQAAELAEDAGFKKYLKLRALALLDDNYRPSDMAWMDMKSNAIDFVVGPIENYEDQLFGIKAAYEAYILLKDREWSDKLNRYAALLPELQTKLPVDKQYKAEDPGSSSDLAAYDVIYYAGDCNAGSKTIAINLPNDEVVQLEKGSRRLQLKNSMKAKFDNILIPIANELISPEQINHITFDAFFGNTMFHEVAHGLGIKNTINGNETVRLALKDQFSTLEENKADILGLFLVTELKSMGELDIDLKDNYTTFIAGLFRSIRFGSSSAHGKANLVRFNYFKEKGAFVRSDDGIYSVDYDKMQLAMNALSKEILVIQGNGDYNAAEKMVEKYGMLTKELKIDLERINSKGIPVDIVFKQGPEVLGLK